jgi:Fic family protein
MERLVEALVLEVRQLKRDLRSYQQELHGYRQLLLPVEPATAADDFAHLLPVLASQSERLTKATDGQAPLNNTQHRVLSYLLSNASRSRWPELSAKQIGSAANVNERWARRTAQELEERGLLIRREQSGRPTLFDLSPLVAQLEALAVEAR